MTTSTPPLNPQNATPAPAPPSALLPPSALPPLIFLGNGPLAEFALAVLAPRADILFRARTRADLATVAALKKSHPSAHAVLASFGVLIKPDLLSLFEPAGILNLHPSLLPDLRGPSPIESAILRGDTSFSISIMKLVKAMDAGPIYHQITLPFSPDAPKSEIYERLATAGATWLIDHLAAFPAPKLTAESTPPSAPDNSPIPGAKTSAPSTEPTPLAAPAPIQNPLLPTPQDDSRATFCPLLTTALSPLRPAEKSATALYNQIRAFQGFPKSKLTLFGQDCTILAARPVPAPAPGATVVASSTLNSSSANPDTPAQSPFTLHLTKKSLVIACAPENFPTSAPENPSTPTSAISALKTSPAALTPAPESTFLELLTLQPAGKKPMPAAAFLNGYAR